MKVLVVDVGGTHVKLVATGQSESEVRVWTDPDRQANGRARQETCKGLEIRCGGNRLSGTSFARAAGCRAA